MPTWNFVRDSIVVAALVVVLAGTVSLTMNLILAYVPDGQDRGVSNPIAIAALYLTGIGLILFLWKSHERPSRA